MTLGGRTKIWTGSYLVPRTVWAVLGLREEGGGGEGEEPPQVKQLFEDEIIVWLHLFTPMAQRGSARQAAQLAVLSHRWARLVVQGHFFFLFFRGVLSILSAGCFSHHSLYLFSNNESLIFAVWKIDGFIRLRVLNVYHAMCAHALSEHGSEAAGR